MKQDNKILDLLMKDITRLFDGYEENKKLNIAYFYLHMAAVLDIPLRECVCNYYVKEEKIIPETVPGRPDSWYMALEGRLFIRKREKPIELTQHGWETIRNDILCTIATKCRIEL